MEINLLCDDRPAPTDAKWVMRVGFRRSSPSSPCSTICLTSDEMVRSCMNARSRSLRYVDSRNVMSICFMPSCIMIGPAIVHPRIISRRLEGSNENSDHWCCGGAYGRSAAPAWVVCAPLVCGRMGQQKLQGIHRGSDEDRLAEPASVFLHGRQGRRRQGGKLVVPGVLTGDAQKKRHRSPAVSRQHRQGRLGQRLSREERENERGRGRHAEVL